MLSVDFYETTKVTAATKYSSFPSADIQHNISEVAQYPGSVTHKVQGAVFQLQRTIPQNTLVCIYISIFTLYITSLVTPIVLFFRDCAVNLF